MISAKLLFWLCLWCFGEAVVRGQEDANLNELGTVEMDVKGRLGQVVLADYELEHMFATQYVMEVMNITDVALLTDGAKLKQLLLEAAKAGSLPVKKSGHAGFVHTITAYVILENAHIVLRCWPNLKYAAVDIFASVSEAQIKLATAFLQDRLGGDGFVNVRLPRGIPRQEIVQERSELIAGSLAIASMPIFSENDNDATKDSPATSTTPITEYELIHETESQFHKISFVKDPKSSIKCMALDGVVQSCTSPEGKRMTEVFAHFSAGFLNSLEAALVVGGGCGAVIDELLKYPDLKHLTIIEQDRKVPELCQKHLGINAHIDEATKDPRVNWRFMDIDSVVDVLFPNEKADPEVLYDLILFDILDLDPNAQSTFSEQIFDELTILMTPQGVFAKNENYKTTTNDVFHEYLELAVDGGEILKQHRFIFHSGNALLVPSFRLLSTSNITTTYVSQDPATRFKQYKDMIVRYAKTGLDFETEAANQFYKMKQRSAFMSKEEFNYLESQESAKRNSAIVGSCKKDDQECINMAYRKPCGKEALFQPSDIVEKDWTAQCQIAPKKEKFQINFQNHEDFPIKISWIKGDGHEPKMLMVVKPREAKPMRVLFGHRFIIERLAQEKVEDPASIKPFIAPELTIVHQHFTHPVICFYGFDQPLSSRVIGGSKNQQRTGVDLTGTGAPKPDT